jgi:leucyl/phenylalanyl-tRNA--protein transferase
VSVIIPPEILVKAYRKGLFPMCHEDGELYWHDPDPRAVFTLDTLEPDRRTARIIRSGRFTITRDKAFAEVIAACAEREDTWIDERIKASYVALHRAGHAHSMEAWQGQELVGGIYGVAVGGAFFGESMFTRASNAGKVAFHALVAHLRERGFVLFDSQYINDFTAQLGAVEHPRERFKQDLKAALRLPVTF